MEPVPMATRAMVLLTLVTCHITVGKDKTDEGIFDAELGTEPDLDEVLSAMTENVVRRYFSNARCVGVVAQNTVHVLMKRVVTYLPAYLVTMDSSDVEDMLVTILNARCLAFVVRVLDPTVLISVLADVMRRSVQRVNRRYLILPLGTQPAVSVLHMKEMAYMPDLVETTALSDGSIVAVTHRYVGVSTWAERQELDVWRDGAWESSRNLYPNKMANLGGRRFVISTVNYAPYSAFEEAEHTYGGMEMEIFLEFGHKHNITWGFIWETEYEWGYVYENFTGNGILGSVAEEKADLGFCALGMWHREYQLLDYSYPYIHTGVSCLTPLPPPLPPWMTPLLPFSVSMWQAVGASVMFSTLLIYSTAKLSRKLLGSRNRGYGSNQCFSSLLDCAFRALGILVFQPPGNQGPEGREMGPTRMVLASLAITFLLVSTTYSSELASVLTVPKYASPIDSVADLVRSGIHWGATHEAWVFSLREASDPLSVSLLQRFDVLREEELRIRAIAADFAFPVERLPGGQFAIVGYINELSILTSLRIMAEDVYRERIATVARKGSPLIEPLNTVIHRLFDAGLILEWEAQATRRFSSHRMQLAVILSDDVHPSMEPVNLHFKHVEGSFDLLVLGLGLSLVAFLLEIVNNIFHLFSPAANKKCSWKTATENSGVNDALDDHQRSRKRNLGRKPFTVNKSKSFAYRVQRTVRFNSRLRTSTNKRYMNVKKMQVGVYEQYTK